MQYPELGRLVNGFFSLTFFNGGIGGGGAVVGGCGVLAELVGTTADGGGGILGGGGYGCGGRVGPPPIPTPCPECDRFIDGPPLPPPEDCPKTAEEIDKEMCKLEVVQGQIVGITAGGQSFSICQCEMSQRQSQGGGSNAGGGIGKSKDKDGGIIGGGGAGTGPGGAGKNGETCAKIAEHDKCHCQMNCNGKSCKIPDHWIGLILEAQKKLCECSPDELRKACDCIKCIGSSWDEYLWCIAACNTLYKGNPILVAKCSLACDAKIMGALFKCWFTGHWPLTRPGPCSDSKMACFQLIAKAQREKLPNPCK